MLDEYRFSRRVMNSNDYDHVRQKKLNTRLFEVG